MQVCNICGVEIRADHPGMFPCIGFKKINGSDLLKSMFDCGFMDEYYGSGERGNREYTYPLDLKEIMTAYREHNTAPNGPPYRNPILSQAFDALSQGPLRPMPPSSARLHPRAPRHLPPLSHRPGPAPAAATSTTAPRQQMATTVNRMVMVNRVISNWKLAVEKSRHERAILIGELQGLADAMKEDKSIDLPITSIAGYSDSEVISLTKTGRWQDIANTIELDFKATTKMKAIRMANNVYSETKKAAENARKAGGSQRAMAEAAHPKMAKFSQNPQGFLEEMLLKAFPDVVAEELAGFGPVILDVLGAQFVNLIGMSIPFISTVMNSLKAIGEGTKAKKDHDASSSLTTHYDILRPGTPGMACDAVVEKLKLHRNIHAAKMTVYVAGAISSIFDGGLVSGPLNSLATTTISIYNVYRNYIELKRFKEYMSKNDPYTALRKSGTVGAYVLVNYPALGLINTSRLSHESLIKRQIKVLKLFDRRAEPEMQETISTIRDAAKRVLNDSLLGVTQKKGASYTWSPI